MVNKINSVQKHINMIHTHFLQDEQPNYESNNRSNKNNSGSIDSINILQLINYVYIRSYDAKLVIA